MKTKIVTRNAGHSKNGWRRTMPMVLGVILATIVISSSKAQADALSISGLVVELAFPAPIPNQFGFGGPQGNFSNILAGTGAYSFHTSHNGDIVTGQGTELVWAHASPGSEANNYVSGTIGSNLANLTDHEITETFTGWYSWRLFTQDDHFPDDQANASFWLTITVGRITEVMDMESVGPRSENESEIIPFTFEVFLPPGITRLEMQMAVAADAESIWPPARGASRATAAEPATLPALSDP
jgi:hypothetical protein